MRPVRTSRPRRGPRERTSSDPNRRIFRVLPAARPSAARWKMVSTIRRASAPVTPPWQLRTVAARSALFNVETRSFLLLQGGRTWGIVRQWEVGGARGEGPAYAQVARRHGNADLWSAQPAAGGRQGRTRSSGVVRLSAGTPAFSVIRTAVWCTPFAGLRPAVPTGGPAFPALCAALPTGVRAETGTTPRAGEARLPLGSAQRCRPEAAFPALCAALPTGVRAETGTTPRAGDARLSLGSAQRCRPEVRRSLPCAPPCPRAYGPRREPLHGLARRASRWAPPSGADRRSGVPCPVRRPAHGGTRRDGNHSTDWLDAVARSCGPRVPV